MERKLMSGNEALARGAWEAGVTVASGYPGTPSTEILEELVKYDEVYTEWAPNEKVAFESGIGASIAGARALVTLKQVGLNVAADPLFTFSYTGVNGGFVFVNADDPQLHSSQNEQDNRHYAVAAKIPMLEPADSSEAKAMIIRAYEISEEFDTPVMLRTTTRISHSKSIIELEARRNIPNKPYEKRFDKYVMLPGNATKRHIFVEERTKKLAAMNDESDLNKVIKGSPDVGIISAGAAHTYAVEAFPLASHLKLGMTYPLPAGTIKKFAATVKKLFVVEELDPFLEDQIKAMGVDVTGKDCLPLVGELNPAIVYLGITDCYPQAKDLAKAGCAEALGTSDRLAGSFSDTPMRPPVMCAGCPHRAVYYVLKRLRAIVNGDIGCYTLGALPPLSVLDTQLCMGTGASVVHGFGMADPAFKKKAVGVIGDSTFIHSGITGLINNVYNGGQNTIIILDNRITAMTGRQHHPATGRTLKGAPAHELDFEKLAKAIGVASVQVVDPYDVEKTEKVIKEEMKREETSLIIARRPCLLTEKFSEPPYIINRAKCKDCGACVNIGCPAIARVDTLPMIDETVCIGCALCFKSCKFDAISQTKEG
jgi:indolepyruvate ferredoxin oxidoreductase, alpha subunit